MVNDKTGYVELDASSLQKHVSFDTLEFCCAIAIATWLGLFAFYGYSVVTHTNPLAPNTHHSGATR